MLIRKGQAFESEIRHLASRKFLRGDFVVTPASVGEQLVLPPPKQIIVRRQTSQACGWNRWQAEKSGRLLPAPSQIEKQALNMKQVYASIVAGGRAIQVVFIRQHSIVDVGTVTLQGFVLRTTPARVGCRYCSQLFILNLDSTRGATQKVHVLELR